MPTLTDVMSRHRSWRSAASSPFSKPAAQFRGTIPAVHVRVASASGGDVFYLDLGDLQGRAVEIRASGWKVVHQPGVHFRRATGMLPLPVPESGGTINLLRPYVNLGELDFRLFVAWLTAAIRPAGPYPPLVLYGEQGSAKTTLAKVARLLIDPHSVPLLGEPPSTRDLMITALNSWLLAFDNIGALPGWLSDCFCRLATGGGHATRSRFTDDEVTYVHAQRPIILNGIDDFVKRGDLIDRSVFLAPRSDSSVGPPYRERALVVVSVRLSADPGQRTRHRRAGHAHPSFGRTTRSFPDGRLRLLGRSRRPRTRLAGTVVPISLRPKPSSGDRQLDRRLGGRRRTFPRRFHSSLKWSGATCRVAPPTHGECRRRTSRPRAAGPSTSRDSRARFAAWLPSFASVGSRSLSAGAATSD